MPIVGVLKKKSSLFADVFFSYLPFFCICRVLFADGDWEVELARRREGLRWCGGGADVLHPARTACHCCRPHPCCVSFQSHFSFRLWPGFGFCFFSRFWLWYLKMYYCPNFHVQAFSSPLHPLRSISSEETGLQKTETEKFTEIEIDKWHVASNLIWIQTKESKTKNDTQSSFQVTRILDSLPDHQNWER